MKRSVYWACAIVGVLGSVTCRGSNTADQTTTAGAPAATAANARSSSPDACGLLAESELADLLGNPVQKGQRASGGSDCKWDTEKRGDVTLLLIVHRAGSIREQVLCPDLRKQGKAAGFESFGDASTWKFESVIGLFDSGEVEFCTSKAFVSMQLNGERDQATLKQKAVAVARKIVSRL